MKSVVSIILFVCGKSAVVGFVSYSTVFYQVPAFIIQCDAVMVVKSELVTLGKKLVCLTGEYYSSEGTEDNTKDLEIHHKNNI